MSTEEQEYTCNYGPWKMYDASGNEVEVKRKPLIYDNIDIVELRRFMRSVEIKAFKHFSKKIEKKIENKFKDNKFKD